MKPELNQQPENPIDLSNLTTTFATDLEIESHFDQKFADLKDKNSWISNNREFLAKNKPEIDKAIKDGFIADGDPETVWKFKISKLKADTDKVKTTKRIIEAKFVYILEEVSHRLSSYLPQWEAKPATMLFTMNDKADYIVDKNIITADLGRLSDEANPIENAIEGMTHEIFHLWFSENSDWSDSLQDKATDQELKQRIVFDAIDEGLAVLVSDFSLEKHHAEQGRNYPKFVAESFESFNAFLKSADRKHLEKFKGETFKNMGFPYVVGNEIAKALLKRKGIEDFRKLIDESRGNPNRMIEEYKFICAKSPELPKIQ